MGGSLSISCSAAAGTAHIHSQFVNQLPAKIGRRDNQRRAGNFDGGDGRFAPSFDACPAPPKIAARKGPNHNEYRRSGTQGLMGLQCGRRDPG